MSKDPSKGEIRIGVALTTLLLFSSVVLVANSRLLRTADFAVPYTSGLMVRHGSGARLYDLSEQKRVQDSFLKNPGLLPSPYPALYAVLFVPLTLLSYRAAYLTWGAINVLLWLTFYYLLRRQAEDRIPPFRYLALCSLFFPVWVAVMQGQVSLVLLLSLTFTYLYLRRGREYAAGLALGVGLLKFPLVAPLALIFTLRRKWKVVGGLCVGCVVIGLVSLIVVGPTGLLSYPKLLAEVSTVRPSNMPTIKGCVTGVLSKSISPHWITMVSSGISACLTFFMAWCWGSGDEPDRDSFDLAFAAAVVISLLATPYLQVHDWSLALLPIILVVGSARWRKKSAERLILIGVIAILYASPLLLGTLMQRNRGYTFAPILLTFAAATLALRRRSAGTGRDARGAASGVAAPTGTAIATS